MPSYVTPKKGVAFIVYFSLPSFSTQGSMQSSPTLASGDFKVSIDGGALANLATLPTNTPGGVMVKASLSTSEMNGDNITIVCIDQTSPKEWCDTVINIQTSAQQIDDLATQASVDTIDGIVDSILVDTAEIGAAGAGLTALASAANLATVDTVVDAIQAKTDNLPSDPADASVIAARFDTLDTSVADLPTNAELATALGTADDAVLAAIAGLNNLSAAEVNAEVDTALADYDAPTKAELDSAVAPLALEATLAVVDGVADAVKAKTDSLTFTVAGQVDANIQYVNDVAVTGNGQSGTEWGPA